MANPNNCSTCGWIADDGKGHCYMFSDEPTEICMQHTGRKTEPGISHIVLGKGNLMALTLMAASMLDLPIVEAPAMKDLLGFPIPTHDDTCGVNHGRNCDCPALAPNRPEW